MFNSKLGRILFILYACIPVLAYILDHTLSQSGGWASLPYFTLIAALPLWIIIDKVPLLSNLDNLLSQGLILIIYHMLVAMIFYFAGVGIENLLKKK